MAKFENAAHPPADTSAAVPRLASVQTAGARTRDQGISRIPALATRNRRAIVVTTHLILAAVAYLTAFALRFDFQLPTVELDRLIQTLPFVLVLRVGLLECFRVSGGSWR